MRHDSRTLTSWKNGAAGWDRLSLQQQNHAFAQHDRLAIADVVANTRNAESEVDEQ